jgi:predicted glutamine amidotransferase
MCVILVCPADVRPDRKTLDACHEANPHGAGVAWREDGEVRWFKGLEPDELEPLIANLTGEIVIHFRWASVGEVTPKLCHPFPITACATTRLSGHARAVLFHNGTWCQWRETLRRMPKHRMPDGLLSDTRVAASLVDLCGIDTLDRLPGRWVFFDRDFTELYGDWRDWRGMQVSNLGFTYGLSTRPSLFALNHTQTADSHHQPFLDFPDACGNTDL